jgi:uncharacterized SAM-binding protein YcdF (DUF218 family)
MSWLRGILLAALVAVTATFGIGFTRFADRVARAQPELSREVDAIVALTGGPTTRLKTAMRLLGEGRGRRLLISGVNPKVDDKDVYQLLDGPAELIACCVDLGRAAEDTLGNASETAAWASRNGFSRLIVVTDDYHMPRSLLELKIAMPEVALIPYPVETSFARGGTWRRDLRAAAALGGEYIKYLTVRGRVALLGHQEAPARSEPAA